MELLVYTIGGQKIGIDIQTWDDAMLSGNTAFLAIQDGGTIPTDYVDISSTSNWDNFGDSTTASTATIKEEIIKLIPDTPTTEEYQILEGYANVGINKMTNIDNNLTMGSVLSDGHLSGVTDTKFASSGGTLGTIAGDDGTLNIDGNIGVGGSSTIGGNSIIGGSSIIGGNVTVTGDMNVSGTIDNPATTGATTGATNVGTGEGLYTGVSDYSLLLKSLSGGTNVTLTSDDNTITINAIAGSASNGKIQLVDSVGGQSLWDIAANSLTWGQQDFYDSNTFTHTVGGSSITVLKTGLYELSFNVNGVGGSNSRSLPGIQFRKNGTAIPPTLTSDYERNTANNDSNSSLPPFLISLTANDVLDVVAFRLGDGNENVSKVGASFVRITYLG